MDIYKQSFEYGNQTYTLETGKVARHASSAVWLTCGDTVILATVVAKEEAAEGVDFFPLRVDYCEKMYAAGKIPGGFLKREGRPSDREVLICRLIDRSIRPLFPKGFYNEVQLVVNVLSLDPNMSPDVPAMIASFAAMSLSGAPFAGPIAAARVGFKDGEYLLNPSLEQMEDSQLDLMVAGSDDAVLMVESGAKELTEDQMLGAILYGHQEQAVVINAINAMADACGKETMAFEAKQIAQETVDMVEKQSLKAIEQAYKNKEKKARQVELKQARKALLEACLKEEDAALEKDLLSCFASLEKSHVRGNILDGKLRIDGRDTRTVRPLAVENRVLPRVHGSALFTRGETQALVTATLGNARDAQIIDSIHGEGKDGFMLQYNFPPYCVGEVGMIGSPKRREVGHGNLAKRAILNVMPSQEEFPYTLRVVSEVTESNGSSSQATVCGASLALMDAGVPLKAPVAGIAMGLIKDGDRFAVLTDILGDEDHLGDMDFKVAGSQNGITALQMDIKIDGLNQDILQAALEQAKEARLHILGIMNQVVDKPQEMSDHAPRIFTIKVPVDKIRDVIGKGGATIRQITEDCGVDMDIDDDGTVSIFAQNNESAQKAIEMVEMNTAEVEVGKIYEGKVVRITDFGAFVNLLPGKDGLVHISQIKEERVENVTDHLEMNQEVKVKVLEIDRQGRVRLTMKDVSTETA